MRLFCTSHTSSYLCRMNKHLLRHTRESISLRYAEGEAEAVARIIIEDGLHLSVPQALQREVTDLSPDERIKLEEMCRRVVAGEPVQYVVGSTLFCGLRLSVTPAVLIPRPETEQLIDIVCDSVQNINRKEANLRILDLGTGNGAIAIALKHRLPHAYVEAWDISEAAIGVARENATACGLSVKFIVRDMLDEPPAKAPFDIIVSNPPYICEREKPSMETHVLSYEPHLALFVPDADPLRFYRAVCRQALSAAAQLVAVECHRDYAADVALLFHQQGFAAHVLADHYGNPRFVLAEQ